MFIKKSQYTDSLFHDLLEIHQAQNSTENLSDQLLLNRKVVFDGNIKNISRILYNSLPTMDEMKPYWHLWGLENGDEDRERSHIVHLTGTFGGANQESGNEDPIITLLIMKGTSVLRHLYYVQTNFANDPSNQYCIDGKSSITILENMLKLLNTCIPTVFGSTDNIVAERYALKCLDNTITISKDLITQYAHEEFKTGSLIYNPHVEISY